MVTRPYLASIFGSLFQAAMLAVRRSVWEAANADFAAAVLFEALQRTATTVATTEASKPRKRCRLKKTLSVANACRPTIIALATLGVMLFFCCDLRGSQWFISS